MIAGNFLHTSLLVAHLPERARLSGSDFGSFFCSRKDCMENSDLETDRFGLCVETFGSRVVVKPTFTSRNGVNH